MDKSPFLSLRSRKLVDQSFPLSVSLRSTQLVDQFLFLSLSLRSRLLMDLTLCSYVARLFDSAPMITQVLASKFLLISEKSLNRDYFRFKPEMIS